MYPIREHEHAGCYQEFFRPEFVSQRLGKAGLWQGAAMSRLGLENPLQAKDLSMLLQGRNRDGDRLFRDPLSDTNSVKGWQSALTADASVNVLWALSPPLISARIRIAHNQAVHAAVVEFERKLNNRPWYDTTLVLKQNLALLAKFPSGASKEQSPQLQTNLILCNFFIRRESGHVSSFTSEQVKQLESQMRSVYEQTLQRKVAWIVGGKVQIPNELCLRFLSRSYTGNTKNNAVSHEKPLRGQQLFADWQELGRGWGWGPEKVCKLLGEARNQTNLRNVITDCKVVSRFASLLIHQRAMELKRSVEQKKNDIDLVKPMQPEPIKKADHRNEMTHSH